MIAKTTTESLAIIELGKPRGASQQKFVLASHQADGSCERSFETSWTAAKYRRLKSWLRQRSQHARTEEGLSELLREAGWALGHGNATHAGRLRAASARAVGRGRWHGRLELCKLMGDEGCVIARGLVPPADCAALLEAAKRGFNSAPLHGSSRKGKIGKAARSKLAGRKVHADLSRGRATQHSLRRDELPAANEAWGRVVHRVADYVGHDIAASSDEAANLCASGMARQQWHQDSAAALAYLVALSDGADGTQFMQIDEPWKDVMALKKTAREAFLRSAWAAATTAHPGVVSGGKMQAGDVLYFYTQRIHRAPPPPAAGSPPRYTLFGAFCKQGKTDGAPVVQGTW